MSSVRGMAQRVPPVVAGVFVYAVVLDALVLIAPDPAQQWDRVLSTPVVAAWCAVVAGQVAIWTMLLPPIFGRLSAYRALAARSRFQLIALGCGTFLLFALLLVGNRAVPDNIHFAVIHQKIKVLIITTSGFFVAFSCMCGMWLASSAAHGVAVDPSPAAQQLESFRRHRDDLDWFLAISGVIVAAATLSTGIIRITFHELNGREITSAWSVILYGAFCSALIAAVYVPSFVITQSAGRSIVAGIAPLPATAAEWIDMRSSRDTLEKHLGIAGSVWDRLSGAIAIIAPLAGSALSLIFSGK